MNCSSTYGRPRPRCGDQMRGRSLRPDPAGPQRWPQLGRRLRRAGPPARRRRLRALRPQAPALLAPSEDGEIEAGPGHVDPALCPFARRRSPRRDQPPDAGPRRDRPPPASAGRSAPRTWARTHHARRALPPARRAAGRVARGRGAPAASALPAVPARACGPRRRRRGAEPGRRPRRRPGRAGRAGRRPVRRPVGRQPPGPDAPGALPRAALDLAALALRDAYVELGELSRAAAASLAIEPRASGYLRVWLARGARGDERLTAPSANSWSPRPTAAIWCPA